MCLVQQELLYAYQQHFYFLPALLPKGSIFISSDTLIPVDSSEISPFSILAKMLSARVLNAVSTFLYSVAVIYKNLSFSLSAKALPSS